MCACYHLLKRTLCWRASPRQFGIFLGSIFLLLAFFCCRHTLAQQGAVGQQPIAVPSIEKVWSLPPLDTEKKLTLGEIEQIAISNNPSIARTTALIQAAQGNLIQVGLWANPTVSVGEAQVGSRGLAEQDYVGASQELVRREKLKLNREIATKELHRAQHELAAQQLRVLTDTRIAFYDVLAAQRRRVVAKELVSIAAESVRAAERVSKGDEIGKNDVIEAQIEQYTAQIDLMKSDNRYGTAWQILVSVTGMKCQPSELDGQIESLPPMRNWQETLKRVHLQSPEVAINLTNLERAQNSLRRAAVEKTPNLTVDGFVNWRDNGIGGRADGLIQLSVPVPFWDRNQGGVLKAESELSAAKHSVGQLELSLQNRLATVFERYINAYQQVRQYRDLIIPASNKALEFTRNNFKAGSVDYNDLLTSQRTNVQANLSYLDALRDLWQAEWEIEGLLLTGSLQLPEN